MVRILFGGFIALLVVAAFVFFVILPPRVDADLNAVIAHEPYSISEEAKDLHESLRVADLHADTLLWLRNPAKRHDRGQTDLPRFLEGGFALQVFSAVTKTPSNLNYDENDSNSDDITLLAIAQRWPMRTWGSLAERALFQASRLERLEEDAEGRFKFIRTKNELEQALESGVFAGVMAAEGAHPLEGELANLDRLYDAGYRVLGLQHFFDNEVGGSLHGRAGAGLTPFGRDVVDYAVQKSMIIDVAHSSEAVVRDVLARTDRPLIVSHTGFRGHCDSARNIPDALMKEIAAEGGLIGVGFWDGAVCDPSPSSIAAAIIYGVELLGPAHVALGSDFDGSVETMFDASEVAVLTDALLQAGLDEQTIRMVMGENTIRFFLENLPE